MKLLHLLPALLALVLSTSPCLGQKVMLTGGHQHLGQESFRGVLAVGVNALFPVGQHLVLGLLTTAGRARQEYPLYVGGPWGGRMVDVVHNHFVAAEALLGYRFEPTARLGLVLGPTLGLAGVGRREESTSTKVAGGLWAGATYRNLGGSRFNLEGAVHPRRLSLGPNVDDGDFTFAHLSLWVWEVQAGISYNLRK